MTASESAAMSRLRTWKFWGTAGVPGGKWLTTAPPLAMISRKRLTWSPG